MCVCAYYTSEERKKEKKNGSSQYLGVYHGQSTLLTLFMGGGVDAECVNLGLEPGSVGESFP